MPRILALSIISLAVTTSTTTYAANAETSAHVGANTSQRVHPLLVGNEHNVLITVAIEVDRPGVRVKSFTFSLDGPLTPENDNPLRDIDSVEMFFSDHHRPHELDQLRNGKTFVGDRRSLMTELTVAFGGACQPQARVQFHGDRLLAPGTNYFWLSCKLREDAELGHKLDATCLGIDTTAGPITPHDASPGVHKRIGYALRKRYDDGVHTCRIPALTVTPKGTLLCVYDLRRTKRRDLQEDIDIGLSRSTDGGRGWEPMRVIMDMGQYEGLPENRNGCSDPGIVVDSATGDIFCAAVWMWGKSGKHQWASDGSAPGFEIGESAQFLMIRSQDDGVSWSEPENLTRALKQREWLLVAPSPQAGLTLRDGTLVLPIEGLAGGDPADPDQLTIGFSSLMTSRDHGESWTVGSVDAIGNGECQVVELRDGSILLNSRSAKSIKHRSVWVTKDLAQTWQPHATHRKALIEPSCNGSMIRVEYVNDGEPVDILVFTNCHSQTVRSHQTLQVSFDEGLTWPEQYHFLLDEGLGNGYPSIAQIDDRHLGIVYEGSQAHLVFEKIAIAELLRPSSR